MPKGIFIRTEAHKKHIAEAVRGKNHGLWKEKPSYKALHDWLTRNYGSPRFCEGCGSEDKKKYEWANISWTYKRDINDFIRLCTSCHRRFDFIGRKTKIALDVSSHLAL